jgi:hypothetical protein
MIGVSIAAELAACCGRRSSCARKPAGLVAISGLGAAFFSACQAALSLNADTTFTLLPAPLPMGWIAQVLSLPTAFAVFAQALAAAAATVAAAISVSRPARSRREVWKDPI